MTKKKVERPTFTPEEVLQRKMKEMRNTIIELLDDVDDLRQRIKRLEAIERLRRGDD